MSSALQIANAIGRARLASELGVSDSAISNAISRGRFPSSWFVVVSDLAAKADAVCSPELFGMKKGLSVLEQVSVATPECCGSSKRDCPAKTSGEFPHA